MADYRLSPGGLQIIRTIDGAVIPPDPANSDFVAYGVWLEAGNTPDPAPVTTSLTDETFSGDPLQGISTG